MKKNLWFFVVTGLFLFGQQVFALSCVPPPKDPFAQAQVVFLAQVTKSSKASSIKKASISAPMTIIKIYKGKIEDIGDNENIHSDDWLGNPRPLKKGALFLLFDHANIGDCTFTNGLIDPEQLKIFEKEHPPIWVRSGTP